VTVNPVGVAEQGGQGGVALLGTGHDRSGRRWDLLVDIDDNGIIIAAWTTADDVLIYSGELDVASRIFEAATDQ